MKGLITHTRSNLITATHREPQDDRMKCGLGSTVMMTIMRMMIKEHQSLLRISVLALHKFTSVRHHPRNVAS